MQQYLKLYFNFVKNCFIREMEFRAHFLLYSLVNLAWAVLAMLIFLFIYNNVTSVGGWSFRQMLLLTATLYFFDRVFDMFFSINFERFNSLVNQGELDFILTKPVSAQFFVSLRRFSFASLFGAISMVVVLGYLIINYFWPVGIVNLLVFLGLVGLGMVIVYSLWFMTLILVFWLGNIDNIHYLFRPVLEVCRVPVDITGVVLRPLLTYVLPLAFVATVPVKNLTSMITPGLIVYGIFAALFLLWLSHRFWRFALKHYTSASS